jgi:hypothetical protein
VWLRPPKFALRYKIAPRTVWNYIKDKKVKTKKIGKTTFIWDGEDDPDQLSRIEQKLDDVRHAVLTTPKTLDKR